MPATPVEVRATFLKIVALLVFVIAADLWATHQFAFGLLQLAAVGSVVTIVSAALPFLTSVLTAPEKQGIATLLLRIGRLPFLTPVLAFLYVGGAGVALTVSTVRVVGDGEAAIPAVKLTFLDRADDVDSLKTGESGRFTALTTPFGRPVRVDAEGFAPATFTVYPLGGLTVRLGRDLPLLPTVLLRPGTRGLQALANEGTIRAWIVGPDAPTMFAETTDVMSSFVVGEPRVIPIAWLEEWRLELTCEQQAIRDQALLAWRRPTLLRTRTPRPAPGDRVRVEVRAVDSTLIAYTEIVMTADPLIEVPLVNVSGIC